VVGRSVDYATRIWSGFALALASLILVGAVGIRTTRELINRDGWVIHTRTVIDRLSVLDSTVKSLQVDLLGYVGAREDHFLHLAQVDSEALDGDAECIRTLVVDNPGQSRRAAALTAGSRRVAGLRKARLL
jgi:CHASE3 domain sensor protein